LAAAEAPALIVLAERPGSALAEAIRPAGGVDEQPIAVLWMPGSPAPPDKE